MVDLTFRKRSGTTDRGKDYEDFFIANLIVDLLVDDNIEDFELSSNHEHFGAFDDVVLQVKPKNDATKYFALQLKHSGRSLTLQNLIANSGDFSIKKYFKVYTNLQVESIDKNKIENFDLYRWILFTNRKFSCDGCSRIKLEGENFDVDIVPCLPEPVFAKYCEDGGFYKFTSDEKIGDSNSYQKFFKNFFLYTNQFNVDQIETNIFSEFQKLFRCSQAVVRDYFQFITEWSMRDGIKIKLNKSMMKDVIVLNLLSPFIKTISPIAICDSQVKAKCDLLREAIWNFQVTYFHDRDFEMTKKFLGELIEEFKENSNIANINKVGGRFQIISRYVKDVNRLDVGQCNKLIWLMDYGPLVVDEDDCVYRAIRFCEDKKFIILRNQQSMITDQNFSVFQCLSDLKQYPEIFEKISKLFTCQLQEKETISLETLIQLSDKIEEMITTSELLVMLDGPLKIGDKKELVSSPYVDRYLTRHIIDYRFLDRVTSDTVIVISNMKHRGSLQKLLHTPINFINAEKFLKDDYRKHQSIRRDDKDIYTCSGSCAEDMFHKICKKAQDSSKAHQFIISHDGRLEWICSKGGVNDLRKFRINDEFMEESKLVDLEKNNNINIICADAGMGKTTLLRRLKNNYSSRFWTIFINPNDHFQYFCEKRINLKRFIEYISVRISRNLNNFDSCLFEIFMAAGHVNYLWDGLDEIPEDNLINVIQTIYKLSEQGCKQWLTSRNNLKKTLEAQFNVLSKTIKHFDKQEQKYYMTKRLQDNEDNIYEDVENLIINTQLIRYNEILMIPLQIYMFVELLFKKYKILSSNTFFLTDLYEFFVDEKFKVFHKEKENFDGSNGIVFEKNKKFKTDRIEQYGKASLKLYFPNKILNKVINSSYETFLDEVKNGKDWVGIITKISDENVPTFLHTSYAEYFAALYLSKHHKEISNLSDLIFGKKYNNIRFLFDLILTKDCPAHLAVLHKNLSALKECSEEELMRKDAAGRNALQLACSWGETYPVVFNRWEMENESWILSKNFDFDEAPANFIKKEIIDYELILKYLSEINDPNELDELYGINSFLYADKSQCLLPLEIFSKNFELPFDAFEHFNNFANVLYYSTMLDFPNMFKIVTNIITVDEHLLNLILSVIVKRGSIKCLKQIIKTEIYDDLYKNVLGNKLLGTAIENGHYDIVKCFMKYNPLNNNIHYNMNLEELLHIVCVNGDCRIFQLLLEKEVNIHFKNCYGETPLYIACERGHDKVAELLIQNGVNTNEPNKFGETPLHRACTNGYHDTAKLLIDNGSNVNAVDNFGVTPLHGACINGHYDIVNLLINHKATVNIKNNSGEMPIHRACANGHYDIVKLLIENKTNVNVKYRSKGMPIHIAYENRQNDIVKLLINTGADVNVEDRDNDMPLHYACNYGDIKMVKLLIEKGAEINAKNKYGETPLNYAFGRGEYELIQLLLNLGADIKLAEKSHGFLMHDACAKGYYEIIKSFIDGGVDVNVANQMGETLVHTAYTNNRENIFTLLINRGADVNTADKFQHKLIHRCCMNGDYATTELLIKNGANLNVTTKMGETAMHRACANGHTAIVELLIKSGADINAESSVTGMPIHRACAKKHFDIVALLIKSGAILNTGSHHYRTPLHYICKSKEGDIFYMLLQQNVNVNVRDRFGITPLHYACYHGNLKFVQMLIKKGADLNGVDIFGYTPLGIANYKKKSDVVEFLCALEAKHPEKIDSPPTQYELSVYQ